MAIKLKDTLLDRSRAAEMVQSLGPGGGAGEAARLPMTVYLADAWFLGLALPGILALVLSVVQPRRRVWIVGGVATGLLVVLWVELKVFWYVGSFLPASFLFQGVFQAGGLQYGADYAPAGSLVKLLALIVATWLTAWFCARHAELPLRRILGSTANVVNTAMLGCGFFSLVSQPTRIRTIDQGVTPHAIAAFLGLSHPPEGETADPVATLPQGAVLAEYRRLTGAPVPNAHSPHFGRAEGFNVVLIILETAPEDCVRLLARDGTFPNLDSLAAGAFVGQRHYATFPWTLSAVYSIYTSWYPSSSPTQLVPRALHDRSGGLLPLPGVVRAARAHGYRTKVYMPRGADDWGVSFAPMEAAGFEEHIAQPEGPIEGANKPDRMEWRRERDRELLDSLEADIRASASEGRPFLFSFQPQFTHAPWPGVDTSSNVQRACLAAREVFKEPDRQVGRIRQVLSGAGIADRTMIVIVGDHGFRTRSEFPWLSGAVLEELTYRVPLIMFVPGLLGAPDDLAWPTSHIDVGPSILDVLGIEDGRASELGSPVWNDALRQRRVFVWGEGFLGADGFVDPTGAYMVKYQFEGAGVNRGPGTLQFRTADLLRDAAVRDSIEREIQQMGRIRDRLATFPIPQGGNR